jgi:hypothetical protein
MATELHNPNKLEPAIRSLLAQLRLRIKAYVWIDGLAQLAIWACGAFWFSLALDWLIEPPIALRIGVIVVVLGTFAVIAYRTLLSRLWVRLEDRSMALLLERQFSGFRDSLLTSVELSERPDRAAEFNSEMVARAHRDALQQVDRVALGQVFNRRPLVQKVSLALVLVASVLVFLMAAPAAAGVWARRSLLMSNELWPRWTHLSVEGFDASRRVKIARGSDWDLVVNADAALDREVPEIVEVRYSTIEGASGRENMRREGVVPQGSGQKQPYAFEFKSVLAPLEFYVSGGDDREGPYYLDVVDSPTISGMTLRCEYPRYTGRASRDLAVAGLMQIPLGTKVTILATANKPLVSVQIDDVASDGTADTHRINVAAESGEPAQEFEFDLGKLDADKTLLFSLRDHDGIASREAVRLALAVVPDEAPRVNVLLQGIGTAITPEARLPAVGQVEDDYGVARAWFDFHVDEEPAQQRPLEFEGAGAEAVELAGVMEVADLGLKPKQRLHWSVQAADNCALQASPNVGTSQKYALDVVTPDQLRSMLEARELILRRQFETIIQELTDTRDLLGGVELAPKPDGEKQGRDDAPAREAATSRLSPAVQVERVAQNSERSKDEVVNLATAFEDIRQELANNRIDTPELTERLEAGIARPLRAIGETRYPPLLEKLKQLREQIASPDSAVKSQAEAVAQIDGILVEMQGILDRMLELETFNEALEMLRKIIETQEEVNEETKQQQKKSLRSLIE